MNRWAVWGVGVALLTGAWIIVQLTPDDDVAEAPFVVSSEIGRPADARTFTVTVTDAHVADRVVSGGWHAEGTWLVVDVEAFARHSDVNVRLGGVEFVADGLTFRASERPENSFRSGLAVDIPRAGSFSFELPASVGESQGVLRISQDSETRLDSVVEIPIDLSVLVRTPEVELAPDRWAGP